MQAEAGHLLPGALDPVGGFRDRFLKACWGEETDCTPVWFMRQAGRYLPEYRALRESWSLLEICRNPELAAVATLQPLRRADLDAAILFSDLTLPLLGMGVSLEVREEVGPVVDPPLRSPGDLKRLGSLDLEGIGFLAEAIRLLRGELQVPLIGFAGAPFTLASYMVEGVPSRDFARTRSLLLQDPGTWEGLMERLAEAVLEFLLFQIKAGVQAVQLFDTWAGVLSARDYAERVLPHLERIVRGLDGAGVPRILFATGSGHLLPLLGSLGAEVVSVDWRVPLDAAGRELGGRVRALQGNLDPAALAGPPEVAEERTLEVLRSAAELPGHVFNTGHGLLPWTPPENVSRVVELVHARTAGRRR